MQKTVIEGLVRVKESYQVPDKLMSILLNKETREDLFKAFLKVERDLSYDWFTNYFQETQADRKDKKQDFTPDEVIKLASKVLGKANSNADLCAGTGGLTIKRWVDNQYATFYVEEFSDAAMPFLLFNLAIRNMNAVVKHGDTLRQEFKTTYKLTKGTQFSDIESSTDSVTFKSVDTVIMNPPYSLKWQPDKDYIKQNRFEPFKRLAPKSKADYAFILDGLSKLNDSGTLVAIMPSGILYRGGAEKVIRTELLKQNLIDTIISLPENLFLKTPTGTNLVVIKKNRSDKNILFINAEKEFTKSKNLNVLEEKHINNILDTYKKRKAIKRFSSVVELDEISNKDNYFNLNIPRYVDTFVPEPDIDLEDVYKDLTECNQDIANAKEALSPMLKELNLEKYIGVL